MKYRKKPVEIEAFEFTGDRFELQRWMKTVNVYSPDVKYDPNTDVLKIPTLEGDMTASKGDYIICGIKGEFYPCKPDIFNETYEKIN